MKNRKPVWALLLVCVVLLVGCATAGVTSLGRVQLPDGSFVDYHAAMSPDPWGIDGKAIDRYQTRSVYNELTKKFAPVSLLIKGGEGFTDGLGKQATVAWGSSAITGASIYGAGRAIRPNTNIYGSGDGGGQGQMQSTDIFIKNNVDLGGGKGPR